MNRTNTITIVLLTGVLTLLQMLAGAAAATPAHSLSLEENVGSSTAIVVARLMSFTSNAIQPAGPSQPGRGGFEGSGGSQQGLIARQAKRPPGVDKFAVVDRLQGQCPDELEVQSPAVIWMFYGNRDLIIPENQFYLLFLTSDKDGHWTPTDETLPLIPLGPKVDAPAARPATEQVDPYDSVIRYLISSLVDPQTAVSSSYFLRKVQGGAVVAAMRPLVNDPNTYTQDHALYCLALNQVVSVIPQIAALEAEHRAANGGTEAVIGLASYNTPEAVPYLNDLLIDARRN